MYYTGAYNSAGDAFVIHVMQSLEAFKLSDMHESYVMSESDAAATGGQEKVEVWMPSKLKRDVESRADDLDVSMAGYLRQLIRQDNSQ